jgi:hypothetical protein
MANPIAQATIVVTFTLEPSGEEEKDLAATLTVLDDDSILIEPSYDGYGLDVEVHHTGATRDFEFSDKTSVTGRILVPGRPNGWSIQALSAGTLTFTRLDVANNSYEGHLRLLKYAGSDRPVGTVSFITAGN